MNKLVFLCLLSIQLISYCTSSSSYYHTVNTQNLKKTFDSAKPYSDLSNAYYSVKGLQLLGENVANAELCTFVKSKVDQNNLESVFYAVNVADLAGNCQLPTKDYEKTINAGSNSQNVVDLYYYAELATKLKQPIDSAKLAKSVTDGLKRDNSVSNQAYALHIATLLGENEVKTFATIAEDLVEQADEMDNIYLQYEGGIGTTSLVLDGIFKLADKLKKFPVKLTQEKLKKFTNYLSTKRYTTNSKSAFNLLNLAIRLTSNQYAIPVIVNRLSQVSVTGDRPNVVVSVTNILGKPVKDAQFTVETQSTNNQKTDAAPLSKEKRVFTAKSSDGSTFEAKLFETTVVPGFYNIVLNVQPKVADKRYLILNNQFEVKFLNEIEVVDLQLGVADREQLSPKLQKIEGGKLKDQLDADQSSKVYVRFGVKAKGSPIEVNQAFVRLTESKTGRDIVFVAELDGSKKQYSCDIDLSTHAKSFNNLNGVYSIELVLSDPLVSQPKQIPLANIKIKFSDPTSPDTIDSKTKLYQPRPEIKHLFREADPRPSKFLSTLFSVLCLVPTLLLVILWFSLGFNFSKFNFSLSGIIFHLSLAAIFGLFYCYWAYLNMFETLRYLAALSIVAFITGKQLLSGLAEQTKEKTK